MRKIFSVFLCVLFIVSLATMASAWQNKNDNGVNSKGTVSGSGGSEGNGSTVAGSQVWVKSSINKDCGDSSATVDANGSLYSKSRGNAGSASHYYGKGNAAVNFNYGKFW